MSNPFAVAATTLESRGWIQDPYHNENRNGEVCIGLALPRSGHPLYEDSDDQSFTFLSKYLRERYGNSDVVVVNDNIIQTQGEALSVLRECARRWETR